MGHTGRVIDESPVLPQTRAIVLETLAKVVESPYFRKSKRYPAFLNYSVQHTLDGDLDGLKERMIGIEVFGRPADYDTNEDPIVRISAGEVRKRLVQYFETHRDSRVRIDLPSGSYAAEFHTVEESFLHQVFQSTAAETSTLVDAPHQAPPGWAENAAQIEPGTKHTMPFRLVVLCAVVLCAVSAVGLWFVRSERKKDFWRPVLQSGQPPVILVGLRPSVPEPRETAGVPEAGGNSSPKYRAVMSNTIAAAKICGMIAREGTNCELISAPQASFSDLRNRSLILVGSYDNPWTGRLLEPLRFQFYHASGNEMTPRGVRYIIDRSVSPDHSPWSVDSSVPSTQRSSDYFLIARFHSDVTDSPVVVTAGIGTYGTRSASECVISKTKMREILGLAPKGWAGFNFEAVLQTDVVQGHSGHTKVLATYFW